MCLNTIYSKSFDVVFNREIGLYLFGSDLSPFLYIGVTFACFQFFGTFFCVIVALNIFRNVGGSWCYDFF